jgi:hypothetical protein
MHQRSHFAPAAESFKVLAQQRAAVLSLPLLLLYISHGLRDRSFRLHFD